MTERAERRVIALFGALLALYLVVPVIGFVIRLAGSRQRGFSAAGLWSALGVSAMTATISTVVICVLGLPLAYVLARSSSLIAKTVAVATQLPLAIPPVMAGILLVYLVGPYAPVGGIFNGHLTESLIGIVLAQCFVASPYLIGVARAAFSSIDSSLLDVSATLGRGPLGRFFLVAIPATTPSLRAGLLLCWLRAFGEFGATVILAFHPYSLPIFTYLQFSGTGLAETQAPTALALMVAVLVVVLVNLAPSRLTRARRPRTGVTAVVLQRRSPRLLRFRIAVPLAAFTLKVEHQAQSLHLAVVGPSGAGKSMTLRALAGLSPGEHEVQLGDRELSLLPPSRRNVGYVPQNLPLIPGRNVFEQVMFATHASEPLAQYWLSRLGLVDLARRYPGELSGGERQRVCLARALSSGAELLLLDEPFSALDTVIKDDLRLELRDLQRQIGLSTVIVTHDPQEAAMLGSELIVLDHGTVLQAGPRRDLFDAPASPTVARLLGIDNVFPATLGADRVLRSGGVVLLQLTRGDDIAQGPLPNTHVLWRIAPEAVAISTTGTVPAVVKDLVDRGSSREVVLCTDGGLLVRSSNWPTHHVRIGDRCYLDMAPDSIRAWVPSMPGADSPRKMAARS